MLSDRLQCLIVEDEEDAVRVLRHYIAQTAQLELVAVCCNTAAADEALQHHKVDLVFLDIDLPGKSGIEWKRGIPQQVQVIFTTAHGAFGAEGFDLDAVDYLLKPFSYERFLRGIARYLRLSTEPLVSRSPQQPPQDRPFLMVRVERMLQKVFLDEVLFVEAKRNHLVFYLDEGTVKVYQSIRAIEARLPQPYFLRIHRSFVVARGRVRAFSATAVVVGDHRLPVGRSYAAVVQAGLSGAAL